VIFVIVLAFVFFVVQNDSVALNRASRGFKMAVGRSHVAPLFEYRNVCS
jgi:hypothetical protein